MKACSYFSIFQSDAKWLMFTFFIFFCLLNVWFSSLCSLLWTCQTSKTILSHAMCDAIVFPLPLTPFSVYHNCLKEKDILW